LNKKWIELKKVRDICNISIEEKRASKEIGSSLEADLIINLNKNLYEIVSNIDFAELCITSSATVERSDKKDIMVRTNKAQGNKCPVCWKINKEKCERHSSQ
jgi:isoleucyl-tRNA synthetase